MSGSLPLSVFPHRGWHHKHTAVGIVKPSFYVVHKFPYYIYCLNATNSFYIGFSVRFLLGKQSI